MQGTTKMALIFRDAKLGDIDSIFNFGINDDSFRVSEKIKFYEIEELSEWVLDKVNNILAVAEDNGVVVGFFFCKLMSSHWAFLDNFYLDSGFRGYDNGKKMFLFLKNKLSEKNIKYLSILVESDKKALIRYSENLGFSKSNKYQWLELFV